LGKRSERSTRFRFDGFCWSNCGDDGRLTCDRCVFNGPNRQCCGVDYDHYYDDINNFYHHDNDGCANNVNDFNNCCSDYDCCSDDDCCSDYDCYTDDDCCSIRWW
jgi:Cu2+-exporting ATPase